LASAPSISFEELLDYQQEQTEQWREFFTKRSHLLKIDVSPTSTIADLIFHTFTSEYRIVQRLLGEAMTQDTDFARRSVNDLFSIGEAAHLKVREYLAHITQGQVAQVRTFASPTLGDFEATPKKLLTHAIVHSIRHWAQVARALRENGQRADFSHDALFSKRLR
jgi:uncharacterized damage-inducible protein DinB